MTRQQENKMIKKHLIKKKKVSFEPDLNQRPKDIDFTSTVLRSTNWAIEGKSIVLLVIPLLFLPLWLSQLIAA